MRRLTPRESAIVAVGVALAVLIPLYLFVFVPQLSRITALNRDIQMKTRDLGVLGAIAGRYPTVQRQAAEISARLTQIERQIPPQVQVPELVRRIGRAIDASGVQLIEITFPAGTTATSPSGSPLQELPFTLHIRGTFGNVIGFMTQLDALSPLVAVQTLGIGGETTSTPRGSPSGAPSLDISMDMKTFALR